MDRFSKPEKNKNKQRLTTPRGHRVTSLETIWSDYMQLPPEPHKSWSKPLRLLWNTFHFIEYPIIWVSYMTSCTAYLPRILSWVTAPCKPKNIQSGRELSTHTCMPTLVPLWLRMTSPSWLTKKPRISLLWRGVGTRHTAQNSFLSTRASGL